MKFTYNLVFRGNIAETCESKNPKVVNENEKMMCDGGDVIEVKSALYGTSGTYGLGNHICQVNAMHSRPRFVPTVANICHFRQYMCRMFGLYLHQSSTAKF